MSLFGSPEGDNYAVRKQLSDLSKMYEESDIPHVMKRDFAELVNGYVRAMESLGVDSPITEYNQRNLIEFQQKIDRMINSPINKTGADNTTALVLKNLYTPLIVQPRIPLNRKQAQEAKPEQLQEAKLDNVLSGWGQQFKGKKDLLAEIQRQGGLYQQIAGQLNANDWFALQRKISRYPEDWGGANWIPGSDTSNKPTGSLMGTLYNLQNYRQRHKTP